MHIKARKARELTGSDIHAFIEQKNITHTCYSCGHDHLSIMSDGPDQPVQLYAMDLMSPVLPDGGGKVEVIGLVCNHCGNIRTFSAQAVVDWKHPELVDE